MAQKKALQLAFCTRSLASQPGSVEHLVKLRIHLGLASAYCTASPNGRGREQREQIVGTFSDNSRSTKSYLLGLGGIITIVGGYFIYHSSERAGPIKARPASRRVLIDDHKSTIGGPFKLINQKRELVTDQDFIGHWTFVYFGYTSCPDDCPEELQKLAEAIEVIEKQTGERVTPVFITLDPKRDWIAQLQAYLSEFHPRIIGLTGSVDDIRQVAREYRVYYRRVEDEGSDYLVEHSNLLYLMDPEMEFVKFFGKEYDVGNLALSVIEEIKKKQKAASA